MHCQVEIGKIKLFLLLSYWTCLQIRGISKLNDLGTLRPIKFVEWKNRWYKYTNTIYIHCRSVVNTKLRIPNFEACFSASSSILWHCTTRPSKLAVHRYLARCLVDQAIFLGLESAKQPGTSSIEMSAIKCGRKRSSTCPYDESMIHDHDMNMFSRSSKVQYLLIKSRLELFCGTIRCNNKIFMPLLLTWSCPAWGLSGWCPPLGLSLWSWINQLTIINP